MEFKRFDSIFKNCSNNKLINILFVDHGLGEKFDLNEVLIKISLSGSNSHFEIVRFFLQLYLSTS